MSMKLRRGCGAGRVGWKPVCAFVLAAAACPPLAVHAQQVRGTLTTTGRYVELRPMVQDSVAAGDVTEREDGTFEFDGYPVFCVGLPQCVYYRPLDPIDAVVLTQDLSLTAWGFGVTGLSGTLLVRGRGNLGGELTWPRSDDPFDAILAYAELNRSAYRVRVGRQRTVTGLGFPGYDGAHARVDPLAWLRVEAYGGRSLARGLEEPRHEALRGLEDFLPDRQAMLLGGAVAVDRPGLGTAATLRYQREIWADRSGLLSERGSVDVRTGLLRPVGLDAALDYDFAFGRVGKAHLTGRVPLHGANLVLEATARRYVPYFELWTIWGFFSPVGYHEVEGQARWTPAPRLSLEVFGGRRTYQETGAPVIIRPVENGGTRLGGRALVALPAGVRATGSYRMERGFGAFVSSGDASVSWRVRDRVSLSAHGSAAQQIEQFRLGEGVLLGVGGSADIDFAGGSRVSFGVDQYRHEYENRPSMGDWSQLRLWAALRLNFGDDPGRLPGRRP
jgi:hypothetical protein